jgi:hypothetical protein
MDEPTRCPGEWFGVAGTGDLDPDFALWFTRAELFGPLADCLQSRAHCLVE